MKSGMIFYLSISKGSDGGKNGGFEKFHDFKFEFFSA